MSPADLTDFLLSFDGTQLAAVRRLLDSRLMSYRHGAFSYPEFERLAQLTDNERYLLIRKIPDTTLAEALKAGSEYLRHSMLRACSQTRKRKIAAKMRRLGPIRQSMAEDAIESILAELRRQQVSGAICSFLSEDEAKATLDAVRAGLPVKGAAEFRIPDNCAELLSDCLHRASDYALREIVTGADASDLALLLLQGQSVTLAQRLLSAGEFRYLRDLLSALLAVRASRETPEPGRPDLRLWQVVAAVLSDNDGVSIGELPSEETAPAPNLTGTSLPALASAVERDTPLGKGTSTAQPVPEDAVEDSLNAIALQMECETPLHDAPAVPLTALQQRRIAQIAATDWALMTKRSEERALWRQADWMSRSGSE